MIQQIKSRRSIRHYINKTVEEEKINAVLESARLAPSGSNTQPWHFIVVKSDIMRRLLMEVSNNQQWMLSAPVFIVCVADIRCRIKDDTPITINEESPHFELKQIIRDTAIAIEHTVLEAENQGLGTCWVAWYKQNAVRPILNIPVDKFVVSIITLGYADEQPLPRSRKKLEEIIHIEKW